MSAQDQFSEGEDLEGNRTFRCLRCGELLTFARLTEMDIRHDAGKKLGFPEPFAAWPPIADEIEIASENAITDHRNGFLSGHLRRCRG